jgi:hypothetical protein
MPGIRGLMPGREADQRRELEYSPETGAEAPVLPGEVLKRTDERGFTESSRFGSTFFQQTSSL